MSNDARMCCAEPIPRFGRLLYMYAPRNKLNGDGTAGISENGPWPLKLKVSNIQQCHQTNSSSNIIDFGLSE